MAFSTTDPNMSTLYWPARESMIKRLFVEAHHIVIATQMFTMTTLALHLLRHSIMEPLPPLQPHTNLSMTVEALITGYTLKKLMTIIAAILAIQVRMWI